MRIIAGRARGRTIQSARGQTTRPTPDRVREALFSIIAAHVEGARVLDLFAGSGALGLEALSRGAAHVVFVEKDRAALEALRKNITAVVGTSDQAQVLAMPAARALETLSRRGAEFDLVLLDPPFESGLLQPSLEALGQHHLLAQEALVVCEHGGRQPTPVDSPPLRHDSTRRFGDVALSFFVREEGAPS